MYSFNIEHCLKIMSFVGLNPEKGYNKRQIFLFALSLSLGIVITVLSIVLVFKTDEILLDDILRAFSTTFLYLHALWKSFSLFSRKPSILQIIYNIRRHFLDASAVKNKKARNKLVEDENYLKIQYYIFFVACVFTCFCRIIVSFIVPNYTPMECYRPQFISVFTFAMVQNVTIIQVLFLPVFCMDMLIVATVRLTTLQFKILNENIRTTMFNDYSRNISRLEADIGKIINRHSFLLSFVRQLNNTFSTATLVYLILVVLAMCVEMYIASIQTEFIFFLQAVNYTFVALFMFSICYCVPAQELKYEVTDDQEDET